MTPRRTGRAREGPFTVIASIATVLSLLVAYGAPAALAHWWPFRQQNAPAAIAVQQERPPVTSVAGDCREVTDRVDFVTCYYGLMPRTTLGWPYIGFPLNERTKRGITPEQSYDEYWGQYASVDVQSAHAIGTDVVDVTITLHGLGGSGNTTERHELSVMSGDTGLKIVGDVLLGH